MHTSRKAHRIRAIHSATPLVARPRAFCVASVTIERNAPPNFRACGSPPPEQRVRREGLEQRESRHERSNSELDERLSIGESRSVRSSVVKSKCNFAWLAWVGRAARRAAPRQAPVGDSRRPEPARPSAARAPNHSRRRRRRERSLPRWHALLDSRPQDRAAPSPLARQAFGPAIRTAASPQKSREFLDRTPQNHKTIRNA